MPVKRTLPFLQVNPCAKTFAFHIYRQLSLTVEKNFLKEKNLSFRDLPAYKGAGLTRYYFRYYSAVELVLNKKTHGVFMHTSW